MTKARDIADNAGKAGGGGKNLVINGAMQIAQRQTSTTGVGSTSNTYPACDRWEIETGNSAGRATMSQESDGPDGFANSTKLACTTADTSVAAGEVFRLQQVIEAQNLQSLAKGTSGAKQFTLSFYVKGNAAATYNIEIYDLDNTRHICASFNVTTSWNRISLTFAGDTTGAINDDNGGGFQVGIYLHAGSTYTSGTLATSWASVTNANRSDSNNTSIFDSTARTFFITGVQLEVGDTATDFEHEIISVTQQKCYRYYYKISCDGSHDGVYTVGNAYNANNAIADLSLPVAMRTEPTLGYNTGSSGHRIRTGAASSQNTSSLSIASFDNTNFTVLGFHGVTTTSNLTTGHAAQFRVSPNDFIDFDAEL